VKLLTLQGIVLSMTSYSDSDMRVVIFSREKGKIVALAKGIKKLSSRKRGNLQSFAHVRFQMTDSQGLSILTEVSPLESYQSIQSDLSKITVAYYFCEIVTKMTQEHESYPYIFDLLQESLRTLAQTTRLKTLRRNFASEILVHLGFWPENKPLQDPDRVIEEAIERKLSSVRVGRQIQ